MKGALDEICHENPEFGSRHSVQTKDVMNAKYWAISCAYSVKKQVIDRFQMNKKIFGSVKNFEFLDYLKTR